MSEDYKLVPGRDDDGNETGYYTREPDGVSGMNVRALNEFCGLAVDSPSAISNWLTKIKHSRLETNDLPKSLKPFAGMTLRLETNDLQGRLIISDDACQAFTEYYAFDARKYKGQKIAQDNFRVMSKAGMRLFIWSKTGYIPQQFREESKTKTRGIYWYKRIGIALSDTDKPLQIGYFCVYLEMMRFFSELETKLNYVIDDINLETGQFLIPDISIGKGFNKWLRSEDELAYEARRRFLNSGLPIDFRASDNNKSGYRPPGSHYYEIVKYNHVYPTESHGKFNIQECNSYPNEYKSIFHHYLEEYWIGSYFLPYLQKRDPKGVEQIRQTLSLMPEKVRKALELTLVGKLIFALPPDK